MTKLQVKAIQQAVSLIAEAKIQLGKLEARAREIDAAIGNSRMPRPPDFDLEKALATIHLMAGKIADRAIWETLNGAQGWLESLNES